MDREIIAGVTLGQLVAGAVLLVLLLVLGNWLRRWLGREEQASYLVTRSCPGCGWRGRVSRLAGRCPRCNTELADGNGAGSSPGCRRR